MKVTKAASMFCPSNRLPPKNMGSSTNTFFTHCLGRIN